MDSPKQNKRQSGTDLSQEKATFVQPSCLAGLPPMHSSIECQNGRMAILEDSFPVGIIGALEDTYF